MNLLAWYEKGMSFPEYVNKMTVNGDELRSIHDAFRIPESLIPDLEPLKQKNLRVIVLAADWCTDAMLCIPILQKLCEGLGWQQRILIRDENLALMDHYLTEGKSRAIPIFIFIDSEGNERSVWGTRSPEVACVINDLRSQLPEKESSNFKELQQEMYGTYKKLLLTRHDLWDSTLSSMVSSLVNA